jgi:bifunctional diaminopimelate decarboxylase / aspartate kinase
MCSPKSACGANCKSSTTSTNPEPAAAPAGIAWWRSQRGVLLSLLGERECAYVYHLQTIRRQARALGAMRTVSRFLYSLKANPHPAILRTAESEGCGFECVSRAEVERIFEALPGIARERVLFTPNFAPRIEYAWALESGVRVTVDNLFALRRWAPLFEGREIMLRLDATGGHGHHEKVRTGGLHSKFGVPPEEFPELASAAAAAGARVAGLHAHGGSGSFDTAAWLEPARILAANAAAFPGARILNLGGGFGVPDRPGQEPFDLATLDRALGEFSSSHPSFELWLEPGRFLVAESGVLLARVTQTKGKGAKRYVGVATGMNSLIRPALYGAHHEIVNLTRLDEPASETCTVVGPICESGDEFGRDRALPRCEEGDVLLIADAGAYGRAMASHYNLRVPAPELVLDG